MFSAMASHMFMAIKHHQSAAIHDWHRCLKAQPKVVAVRAMVDANGKSKKTKGEHWSPYELRVYIMKEREEYGATVGLTDHGSLGLRVYMRPTTEKVKNAGAAEVFLAAATLLDAYDVQLEHEGAKRSRWISEEHPHERDVQREHEAF